MLTADDLVVLTNNEDHPLSFTYDGKRYGVPAGASVHLPFEVVKKEFGDPRSGESERLAVMPNGNKIRIASRARELERLTTLYGVGVAQQIASSKGEEIPTLQSMVPNVTVKSVEGETIPTVVQDPSGDQVEPIPAAMDTTEALAAQIKQMEVSLAALQRQAKVANEQPQDGEEVVEDSPTNNPPA